VLGLDVGTCSSRLLRYLITTPHNCHAMYTHVSFSPPHWLCNCLKSAAEEHCGPLASEYIQSRNALHMQIVAANRGWIDYSLRLGILQPSGWLNGDCLNASPTTTFHPQTRLSALKRDK